MRRRRAILTTAFLLTCVSVFGRHSIALAREPRHDPRDMAIDRTVGGMVEGSRILHPRSDVGVHQAHQKVHGTESGHGKEAHATASSGAHPAHGATGTDAGHIGSHPPGASGASVSGHAGASASHAGTGMVEHHAGVGTHGGANTAGQTNETNVGAGEQAGVGSVVGSSQGETGQTETGGNPSAQEGNHGILIGGNLVSGETAGSETTGSGSTETAGGESSGSDRSIVEVDTSKNLSGENPDTSGTVSVDTGASGGLLDVSSEIDQGATSGTGGSETTSGDSNYIIEADANLTGDPSVDLTVDTSAGGGLLDTNVITDAGTVNQDITSGSSETTSGGTSSGSETTTSGSSDHSIIEADTNADLSGESPSADANVTIDPNATGGLLDVNADTEVDVVDQELTSTTGLSIDLGENEVVAESELGNELGTSDAPATSEAETGLEADVEGIGATEDTASDPADGLTSTPGL